MPVFTIQSSDGRKIKIEAADQDTAIRGAQEWAAANPVSQAMQLKGTVGKMDPAQAGVSQNVQMADGSPVAPMPQPQRYRPDLMTSTAATVGGLVNSVPFLQNVSDAIIGAGSQLTGGDYGETVRGLQQQREAIARSAPLARMAGEIGGGIAGFGALGASKLGAEALGLTGNLGRQMTNAGLSSAAYGGLQSLSAGNEGADVLRDMGVSGAIGAASPVVAAGLRAAGRGINENVIRPIATMANRDNEAIARVGRAVQMDRAAGNVMSQADEAIAARAGAPVMNADRFGAVTRTLTRTASNVSPEAQGMLQGAVQDRFMTQGTRAKSFVSDLMGGAVDDLALQDALRQRATQVNNRAYEAARANPASRAIWNQPIKELMQSSTFRAAIADAEKRGSDRAAIAGFKAVRNPFEFTPDGGVTLKVNPDGSRALPSLDFWDQVKRNLDGMIGTAQRQGDRTVVADLTGLKRKLTEALDQAVPEYRTARQGAAAFFGADDALDAGRKAFSMTKQVPELRKAHAAMSGPEKDAAAVGYASSLIDAIDASRDRVNVINNLFGSESARARNQLFLGSQRARELEAYVKVEQTLDLLRNAVSGGSNTTQQLFASGALGGGAGFLFSGGDLGTAGGWAFLASAGRRGLQMIGKRVDDQVMKRVAEMLASGDPAMVQRAIQNATISKAHMDALNAMMKGLELGARGAVLSTVN